MKVLTIWLKQVHVCLMVIKFIIMTVYLQIHWFSIFNSFMMVIFLVGLVSMILMRTLRKDYARYSREDDMDDMVRFLLLTHFMLNLRNGLFRLPYLEWFIVSFRNGRMKMLNQEASSLNPLTECMMWICLLQWLYFC